MKKNSLTIRSVTFAAVAGLSLGIAAPGAIAVTQEGQTAINQPAGDSPLVNKNAKGSLTIHKFGNPTSLGQPSGTQMMSTMFWPTVATSSRVLASPSTRSTRLQMAKPTSMSPLTRACWLLRS